MPKNILLCIPNGLIVDGIERMLYKKSRATKVYIETHPQCAVNAFKTYHPDTVIIEVKDTVPYTLNEWIRRILEMREILPRGKIAVIINDENYPEIALLVKKEKAHGMIDAFFYASSGLSYVADAIESL